MKATEAAKLADVIHNGSNVFCYKSEGVWVNIHDDPISLEDLHCDYVPLVPLKQYAVGDVVKVWEAIGSGKFFTLLKNGTPFKGDGETVLFWNVDKWEEDNEWHPRILFQDCFIVADPSVPQKPKPTIKSLAPGTLFKAKWHESSYECIRGWDRFYPNDGSNWGCHWVSLGDTGWTLTHIKSACSWFSTDTPSQISNGEWEEV